jgi:Zn-dependent protease
MWQQGYVRLFRLRGIPVRLHWSVALGMLWVSGPHFRPGSWLGLAIVILVHELGHAYLARRYRLQVHSIEMDALGGACVHEPARIPHQDHVIAWGGVLAQALLYALVLVVAAVGSWPGGSFGGQLHHTLTSTNLFIIAFNLLPFPPLDGASAWKLLKRRPRLGRAKPSVKLKPKPPREVSEAEREQIDRTLEQVFEEAKRKE